MKNPPTTSCTLNLRILLSTMAVLGLILMSVPASPARPLPTTAQQAEAFPPQGEWYTYANGDDILVLEMQGDPSSGSGQGILWAGTRAGGLVRWDTWDGSFVQFLKPQDGLAGNTVRDIFIDASGKKWLATDHGLSVLDDKGTADKADDEWYAYTRASTNGNLPSNRVTAVTMDGAGMLWIGTGQYWDSDANTYVGGGLAKVDTRGNLNPSDDVWLQTYTVANTADMTSCSRGELTLGLASNNVTDILPVAGNRVWIATQRHWAFSPANNNPCAVLQSTPGDPGQWVQIFGGLSRLDHAGTPQTEDDTWKTWTCEAGPQRSAGVSCAINQLKLDINGYVWAAMRGKGVIGFPQNGDRTLDYVLFDKFDSLATNDVDSLAFGPADDPQWRNTVWISTYDASSGVGRGVCVLDHRGTIQTKTDDIWNNPTPTGGCFTTTHGLPDDRVQAMVVGAGKIWMGTGGRFGTAHGISAFDPSASSGQRLGQQLFHRPLTTAGSGLPYNYITDLVVGQEGTRWENQVWVATGNMRERRYGVGALLLNTRGTHSPGDDTWTRFTKEETDDNGAKPWTGLASNNVTALASDGDNVWMGTQPATWEVGRRGGGEWTDGGLSVFDGERWTIRTDANTGGQYAGMLDDRISALAVSCRGEVWIALGSLRDNSGLGITVLNPMGDPHNRGNDTWQVPIKYPTIPSSLVTGIAGDCTRNQMWISTAPYFTGFGTLGGGVARYNYDTNKWTSWTTNHGIESFRADRSDAVVHSIGVAVDGAAWAGTMGVRTLDRQTLVDNRPYVPAAINWFRGDTWSSQTFDNDGWVSSVAIDENGVAWVGTSRGGMDIDADGKEDDGLADRAVGGLKLTVDGSEWVSWTPDNSPLVTNDIEVITISSTGEVWIGTNGWGIMRFRPGLALGASPTPAATQPPSATPVPTRIGTSTPLPSPTAVTRNIHRIYLSLLARDWFGRPLVVPTAAPSTATPAPTQTPPGTSTPTATQSPTPAPPTHTPTTTPTPGPTNTPTITPTPGPGVWCPGTSLACNGVRLPTFPANDLHDVAFADAQHGLIVGDGGFVARTTDGGRTWTWQVLDGAATLRDVFVVNPQVAFIAGDDKTVWHTTNGGSSFSRKQLPLQIQDREEDFWAIYATSENDAWVMGHKNGIILKWDGQTWNLVSSSRGTGYAYNALALPTASRGWAVAETGHIYQYNGFWAIAPTMRAGGPLRAIDMYSQSEGWAAGDFGVVVHYANGRWTESRINRPFYRGGIRGLHVVAPNDVWAAAALDIGERAEGAIFRYRGNTWEQVFHTPVTQLNAIWVHESLMTGWAVGNRGLLLRYVVP